MVDIVFELKHGEKLDYTFDFTPDCDAVTATIEGTPVVTVLPASPALTVSAVTVDATVKKATISITAPTSGDLEYTLSCKANLTGNPDRDFVQGIIIRMRPPTPMATGGVTTVGRIVSELGITDAAKQSLVSDIILEATEAIEKYIGYKLLQETITEAVSGSAGFLLSVSRVPLSSITSISFDSVALATTSYRIHNADAGLIWLDGGVVDTSATRDDLSRTSTGQRQKLYSVVYVAGYVMPGVTGRTLPRDIERAGIELVKSYLNSRSNPEVQSESVPDVYSVTYFDSSGDEAGSLPKKIAEMLDPHRMLAI